MAEHRKFATHANSTVTISRHRRATSARHPGALATHKALDSFLLLLCCELAVEGPFLLILLSPRLEGSAGGRAIPTVQAVQAGQAVHMMIKSVVIQIRPI